MPHFPRFSAIALFALIWLACCPPARPAQYDMVEMTVASAPGTGTITFGTALLPYRPLSATGAVSGELVPYHIADGANWENGRGIVNFGANTTLTRGPVSSSNGGGLITATSSAVVWVAMLAGDMVTTVYPSSILAPIASPACPLTDAATIQINLSSCQSDPTKGVARNTLTLTASGHKLAFPTGIIGSGSDFLLSINEGSGPFTVNIAQGLFFPPAAISGQQLLLSGTANGKTDFYCWPFSVTEYHCGAPQIGLVQAAAPAWDLVHKNANITISGVGNLIATASGASADKAGYANTFHSTGKVSFAVTATSVATSIGIGIGNSSATTTTFCGNDGNSICYYAGGSTLTNNGTGGGNTSGLPTFATGNKIWIAVHFTGTQTNLWVNKSATAPGTSGWVGNGGTSGNPDTDTNPIVFNSTAAVSPAYDLFASGDQVTADFLTSSGLATYSTW